MGNMVTSTTLHWWQLTEWSKDGLVNQDYKMETWICFWLAPFVIPSKFWLLTCSLFLFHMLISGSLSTYFIFSGYRQREAFRKFEISMRELALGKSRNHRLRSGLSIQRT